MMTTQSTALIQNRNELEAHSAEHQPALKRPRVSSQSKNVTSTAEPLPVTCISSEEISVLDEKQHIILHNNYQTIRFNLRKALTSNSFTRLWFILKFFTKNGSHPEPDTFDLIADCLQRNGRTAEAIKFREAASKLRGDSLYYSEGNADPIERLANAIGSTEGDYDLITTDIRSEPRFGDPDFKKMVLSDGKCSHHIVISLRIPLEVCPDLSLGVDEVCTEARELCDERARSEEIEAKVLRLKRVSAFRALRKLQDLVNEAREKRLTRDDSDDEFNDGLSAEKKLFDLVMNPEGTLELFLSPHRSAPKYEIVSNDEEIMEFKCFVRLDISEWISVELDEVIAGSARRKYPVRMPPDLRKQRLARVKSLAAEHVMEKINNTSLIIRTHAQQTLRREVKKLITHFRVLNGTPLYPSTFDRVSELACSGRGADMFGYKLNVFGSMPTELALDGSDLDMNITLPPEKYLRTPEDDEDENEGKAKHYMKKKDEAGAGDEYPRDVAKNVLIHLKPFIARGGMTNVQCITSARVPLLKFTDPQTNIDVDLTVSNLDGALQSRLLRHHLRVDSRIWELAVIVRFWAKQRNVSGLTAGFINPLGWTVMVIYFMQHIAFPPIGKLFKVQKSNSTKAAREDCIEKVKWQSSSMDGVNRKDIDQLVKQFFREFSSFPFDKKVISLNTQNPREKSDYAQNSELGRACPITIEQPLLRNRNIVGYVSESCMKETKNQMVSTLFRMENIGTDVACFSLKSMDRADP